MNKHQRKALEIEVMDLTYSYLLDTFVQWQFGRSIASNLVENEKERRFYFDGFLGVAEYTFWQYHFPWLVKMLQTIGIYLIPKSVLRAFESVEAWNLEKCDQAQQLLPGHTGASNGQHGLCSSAG